MCVSTSHPTASTASKIGGSKKIDAECGGSTILVPDRRPASVCQSATCVSQYVAEAWSIGAPEETSELMALSECP